MVNIFVLEKQQAHSAFKAANSDGLPAKKLQQISYPHEIDHRLPNGAIAAQHKIAQGSIISGKRVSFGF
jgi:hypothetical protein